MISRSSMHFERFLATTTEARHNSTHACGNTYQTFRFVPGAMYTFRRYQTALRPLQSAPRPLTSSVSDHRADVRVRESSARRSWPVPRHPAPTVTYSYDCIGRIAGRLGRYVAVTAWVTHIKPYAGKNTFSSLFIVRFMGRISEAYKRVAALLQMRATRLEHMLRTPTVPRLVAGSCPFTCSRDCVSTLSLSERKNHFRVKCVIFTRRAQSFALLL